MCCWYASRSHADKGRKSLVVGAVIGLASASSYLFIVDQPITAADLDAVSQQEAVPLPARGA
jgi:hypothetical protein